MANECRPNIQARLNDLYQNKVYRSNVGTLDFLFSPVNGSELQAELVGRPDGKNTRYAVTVRESVCDAVSDCSEIACTDAPTATSMTSCLYYDSFDCTSSKWFKAGISQLRDIGSESVMNVISGHVMDQMGKIKDSIDAASVVAINTAAGDIASGVATKTIKLIDDTTKAPAWMVDSEIKTDFMDAGFNESPVLVGSRQVKYFADSISRAGMNNAGLNLGQIDTLNAFYDININSTNAAPTSDGNEVAFAILPQVANMITWSANAGIFASRQSSIGATQIDPLRLVNTDGSTFLYTTITDPATGMVFDFDLVLDARCKEFQWRVYAYHKLIILPLTGCKFADFNGIVKYDVCPLTATSCP